jgi:multidrug efflux system membrane fusion protein
VLAQIDESPFLAQLKQYEGQLAKDLAQLANAKIDLARYQALWKEDSVSKQILDTQQALVNQLEGTVKADQGLIDTIKVNLAYCRITSPINGRLGLRLVDPGNFVQTSDTTGLFVVNNVRPITVVFTIPEDNVPQVIKQMKAGEKLQTQAYDRSQNNLLATGSLLTIDNQIDPTTGTVKLKAIFKNEDDGLFPNQFVNIRLRIMELNKALTIPTSAVLHGTKGDYVYTLNIDKTVQSKPVVVSMNYKDDSVIASGLTSDDVVVIEGTDKLVDGASVVIHEKTNNQNEKKADSSKSA